MCTPPPPARVQHRPVHRNAITRSRRGLGPASLKSDRFANGCVIRELGGCTMTSDTAEEVDSSKKRSPEGQGDTGNELTTDFPESTHISGPLYYSRHVRPGSCSVFYTGTNGQRSFLPMISTRALN